MLYIIYIYIYIYIYNVISDVSYMSLGFFLKLAPLHFASRSATARRDRRRRRSARVEWATDLYELALAGGAESGKRVETDKAVYAMTVSPLSNPWIATTRRTRRSLICAAERWAQLAASGIRIEGSLGWWGYLFFKKLGLGREVPPRWWTTGSR